MWCHYFAIVAAGEGGEAALPLWCSWKNGLYLDKKAYSAFSPRTLEIKIRCLCFEMSEAVEPELFLKFEQQQRKSSGTAEL